MPGLPPPFAQIAVPGVHSCFVAKRRMRWVKFVVFCQCQGESVDLGYEGIME